MYPVPSVRKDCLKCDTEDCLEFVLEPEQRWECSECDEIYQPNEVVNTLSNIMGTTDSSFDLLYD